METLEAIAARRSIRKFTGDAIAPEVLETILRAGIQAPSAKNRQPWEFIVVTEKHKSEMLRVMAEGIANEKNGEGILPGSARHIPDAEHSLKIMEDAPVTVFIFCPDGGNIWRDGDAESRLYDAANLQSVGAAIENMILAATDLGIGSLWNCNVYFAYRELCSWLGGDDRLVAAVSFGYPAESPGARPRKQLGDVVRWM